MLTTNNKPVLIAIPYAGGNKYSFKELGKYLKNNVELITIEAPGRGSRIMEPLLLQLDQIVDDLFQQIQSFIDSDYAFYGHSMGGILGHRLIQKLRKHQMKLPNYFLISGCMAPSMRKTKGNRHLLNDEALKNELIALGGFPKEVLESEELMEFILPILRADFQALETSKYYEQVPYNVPLHVIIGTEEDISTDQAMAWKKETTSTFQFDQMNGNHFFILDHFKEIAAFILEKFKEEAALNL